MTNHSGGGTPMPEANCCEVTKEELCASTLAHYDDISMKACHWHNQVPQAIRFWYLDKPRIEAELAAAQSALARVERDKQAYRGALGYSVTGAFDGRTSDGTIPICGLCEANHGRAERAEARAGEARLWLDNNTTFYDVSPDGPNVPVLASVSKRIWYHATDNQESYPFSAVIDAAPPASPMGRKE